MEDQRCNRQMADQAEDRFQSEKDQKLWIPEYHLYPPAGWLNDPNGLCQKDGIYHVFYQYSPLHAEGGDKCWGHYRSRDLIHWQSDGAILFPDTEYDRDGVYSGCAFCEDDQIRLYYTGNVKQEGTHDYIYSGREANTILVTTRDGIQMSKKQLLMRNADYPDYLTCHVRDPKVWKEGSIYYMIQGGRLDGRRLDGRRLDERRLDRRLSMTDQQDAGCVIIFTSQDGVEWKVKEVLTDRHAFGYMWECPDLFSLPELPDKKILSFSPQGLEAEPYRFQNIYQSGYVVVNESEIDQEKNAADQMIEISCRDNFTEWDMGFDFYAPQTFEDEQGRRILIGWMGIPDADYTNPTVQDGWQHMLTVPRELRVVNQRIHQLPIEELKQLRGERFSLKNDWKILTESALDMEITCDGTCPLELVIAEELILSYEPVKRTFEMKFTGLVGSGRERRVIQMEDMLENLRILIDRSSIEVFLNDGTYVMTTRFYPEEDTIMIQSHGTNITTECYPMNSYLITKGR